MLTPANKNSVTESCGNGEKMRNKWKRLLHLSMMGIVFLALAGCGGKAGTTQENTAKEDNGENGNSSAESGNVYEGENDTFWYDKLSAVKKSDGAETEISVDISAKISVPEVSDMSVIEVQGLRVEKEKTEPGDAGKWGGEEYKYCIARDVQDELRKKMTESSAIAGGDVKFSVFFGNSYSVWGDIMLSPEGAFNWKGAFINPERMADVASEKVRKEGRYLAINTNSADFVNEELALYTQKENLCSLTEEESRKKAEEFLNDIGLGSLELYDTSPLLWGTSDTSKEEAEQNCINGGNLNEAIWDGYSFVYGQRTASGGEIPVLDYQLPEGLDEGYPVLSMTEVCVNEKGVVYAEINGPSTILSETSHVKLMSMDKIKECMKNNMQTYLDAFFERAKVFADQGDSQISHGYSSTEEMDNCAIVKFNKMEFGYWCVRKEDESNMFSYVPAWKLSMSSPVVEGEGNGEMLVINAIDGSMIDVWDGVEWQNYLENIRQGDDEWLAEAKEAAKKAMEKEETNGTEGN